MMCTQALESHMSVYIWLCTSLPPGKQMKEDKKRRRACQSCPVSSQFSPISPLPLRLLVFRSEAELLTSRQAEWRSGAERHRSRTALTAAIGWRWGVRWQPFTLGHGWAPIHPSPCLPAGQWKEKRIRRADERREGVREKQQVYYYHYYLSLH